MMDGAAVWIEDLHYAYPDGTPGLRGLSLTVREGEKVAIVGPNGAGKSTLMLHLNGLLQGQGAVEVLGLRVEKSNYRSIRQAVGIVFQEPDDQLFNPTVHDDVAFGPRNLGLSPDEVERRVTASLAAVGLPDAGARAPFRLSVGEKKRAAIATVLAMQPRILVLDEPTSNLDPRGRKQLIRLLRELGRTQLIATHDLALAADLCDRVVVMAEGRNAAQGNAHAILNDQALLEANGLA